jgi:hypothetical protein
MRLFRYNRSMPFYAASEDTLAALDPGAPVPTGGDSPVLDYLTGVWQDAETVSRARVGPAVLAPAGPPRPGKTAPQEVVVEVEVP